MLPKRVIKSLNLFTKKSNYQSKACRRNFSAFQQNCHALNFRRMIADNWRTAKVKKDRNARYCSISRRSYTLKTTNIIRPDNVVVSPYQDIVTTDELFYEMAWKNVDRFPDLVAIECSNTGKKYSFSQLRQKSRQFGAALLKSGIKPRQTMSVLLPNIPEFPIVMLGAAEAGIVVSTINPLYTYEEVYYHLKDSNSVCIVTFADKVNIALQAKAKILNETKGSNNLKVISIQDYDGISRSHPEGVWSFTEMIENKIDANILDSVRTNSKISADDVAFLPYSSGTTGLPKGVCLTNRNLTCNMKQIEIDDCKHLTLATGNFQDVTPAILPFFHIYGMHIILLQGLKNGAKLVTMAKFDAKLFIKLLKDHKSTVLYIVPPILLFMGMNPEVTRDRLEHVRFITSGAAPAGSSDVERIQSKLSDNACILQAFGLTETSPVVLIPRNKKSNNYSTVGYPVSVTKIKVVSDDGKNLGVGEKGEICIHGPQVMKGYYNKPESTANTIDKDGWLHSGDIGYYDESGQFYIVDRKKELIKVKGFQVAPAELEELLRAHPQVADAAVIGVPDAKAGEVPVAYIVPKTGQKEPTPNSLKEYIANKVADYKQLSQIFVTNSIPKSASGKILRRLLKDNYTNTNLRNK